jgi:hypothetical protein
MACDFRVFFVESLDTVVPPLDPLDTPVLPVINNRVWFLSYRAEGPSIILTKLDNILAIRHGGPAT